MLRDSNLNYSISKGAKSFEKPQQKVFERILDLWNYGKFFLKSPIITLFRCHLQQQLAKANLGKLMKYETLSSRTLNTHTATSNAFTLCYCNAHKTSVFMYIAILGFCFKLTQSRWNHSRQLSQTIVCPSAFEPHQGQNHSFLLYEDNRYFL